MDTPGGSASATSGALNGGGIIAAIKASGIEYVLSVPDIVTSSGLLRPIADDRELRLIRVCKEDECIGIASGLSYCDKRALILIQHTGFLDSINAIRGIAVEYKQPICMMVGLLQHDPELAPRTIAALWRADHGADPRRHGHCASPHQRRRRRGKNPAGDREGLCCIGAGCVSDRAEPHMMKRDECFRVLARHLTDEAVVATYSSAVDWVEIAPRVLNYTSIGAMGLDSSHGLGLALGRPDKRVVVLQGDGSLLMNLGSLVTIAAVAPKNLVHLVAQNETYEANGGHPIPSPKVDFAGMARAAGYAAVYEFSDLDVFTQQVAHVLEQDGPVFATLHIEPSKPLTYDYPSLYDPAKRKAFKAAWQARS